MQKFGGSGVNVIIANETDDECCACGRRKLLFSRHLRLRTARAGGDLTAIPRTIQHGSKLSRA